MQNIDLTYTRNKYLDKDNEDKKNNYLKMIPSVLINNRTFYVKIKNYKINILQLK